MATRFGVDVGGTFTDLVLYNDETGETAVAKVPTTPSSPEDGILAAVAQAIPAEVLGEVAYFLHGTTMGINALLTRTGAVVGLLCTEGFRDILEIRRGDFANPYDLFCNETEPLVPRRRRLPVTERMSARGEPLVALEEESVRAALAAFEQQGVTSIAVAFLNAYVNPAHELAAEEALRRFGFEGAISLSHRASGEHREYERTSTAVIDAYVRPRMSAYFESLAQRLGDVGFAGTPIVMRSGGGAMTFEEAEQRPFETIMSGPVAGVEGAGEVARRLGLEAVITADAGGTSFETCLIEGGQPAIMYQGEVEGMPVLSPWVDVRSIGAGGGSIAHVDVGGLLRVGPASAGAVPGPACYGRGGSQPAVTDAAFYLGMLGKGRLSSGIELDRDLAEGALAPLADRLGLSVSEVARGIMTIAAASMANAIREITIERGRDPRTAVLLPFGGTGPLFATMLARELEIETILVPSYAGNFSAWGLLGASLSQSAAQTRITALAAESMQELDEILAALYDDLEARAGGREFERSAALDMRYVGQEHTLSIPAPVHGPLALAAADMRDRFHEAYERNFDHVLEEEVEIVAVRASSRSELPRRTSAAPAPPPVGGDGRGESVEAWSFTQGRELTFPIVHRDAIGADGIAGPAVIVEDTTTTYLDAEFAAAREGDMLVIHDEWRAGR